MRIFCVFHFTSAEAHYLKRSLRGPKGPLFHHFFALKREKTFTTD
jgi:hypothetical protein